MDIKYIIRCEICGFKRVSDGTAASIADLREVVLCAKCSGPKTFKCPDCGRVAKAKKYVEPPLPQNNYFKLH